VVSGSETLTVGVEVLKARYRILSLESIGKVIGSRFYRQFGAGNSAAGVALMSIFCAADFFKFDFKRLI
jgi:hypothetical protein